MTGFAIGSKVYWHGLFPDINKTGATVRPGRTDDINQLVQWDGQDAPEWVRTDFVKKLSEHNKCVCGRCGAS